MKKIRNRNGLIVDADGDRFWYQNDRRHRTDGPAAIHKDGTKEWYINGELHRTDGPAYERYDGAKFWYQNDQRHRIDGPAREYPDGSHEWWINGEWINFEVRTWLVENNYTWPFDEATQVAFKLRFL